MVELLNNNSPSELNAIIDGRITAVKPGSLSFQILHLLIAHPEGLSYQDLIRLTRAAPSTLHACLFRLPGKREELLRCGLLLNVDRDQPKKYIYRIQVGRDLSVSANSSEGETITAAMCARTRRDLETVLRLQRTLAFSPTILEKPPFGARNLLKNSTWAFHQEHGAYAAVQIIFEQALDGVWTTAQFVRRLLPNLSLPRDFFHKLEKISLFHAPELGFAVRCLTELPKRGRMAAFFLDTDYRKWFYTSLHSASQEITYFARVRAYNKHELDRRVKRLEDTPPDAEEPFDNLDKELALRVAEGQAKRHYYSLAALTTATGISKNILTRRIKKSMDHRQDWRFALRVRSGGGVECILYEGEQAFR